MKKIRNQTETKVLAQPLLLLVFLSCSEVTETLTEQTIDGPLILEGATLISPNRDPLPNSRLAGDFFS